MRYLTIVAIFFIAFFASCNNGADNSFKYSLRDSVTKKHLEALTSSDYFDTTDINYKTLKAYLANDTSFFKKLNADIDEGRKFKRQREHADSCIHQVSLQALNADEAYRFVYSAAFCQYELNVTISKTGDNSNIHFIILQYVSHDSTKVINEYDREITAMDWGKFSELMVNADFWGLKNTNGVYGFDGSTLITTGYSKRYKPKYNYVHRWCNSTLNAPFHFVLKLSGNKQGCLVVR